MNSFRQQAIVPVIAVVALVVVSGFAGYYLAGHPAEQTAGSSSIATAEPGRRVLYWYDPMQPSQHFDKPGRSPFMDMQLIPKFADGEAGGAADGIHIDPAMVQNLGIRLTRVEKGPLARRIDAVGSIGFDQRNLAVIQARSYGFVTRVYSRAPGDVIQRGAPIVDLLVPEWTGAQTEFVAVLSSGDSALIDAARQRLVLLGMPADSIAEVERRREAQEAVTVHSPLTGVIATLDARAGMSISAGANIASVNDLATVWLEAAIPEARAVSIAVGREVKARLTAFPGETFAGRVIALLPQANTETRTLRIRIELPNPSGRLRPGMYAQVSLEGEESQPVVYVASEALVRTGTRILAIVADVGGRFFPTLVEAGPDIDGKTVILHGLKEGQQVVASGQFLIDSEASLNGALARLAVHATPQAAPDSTPGSYP